MEEPTLKQIGKYQVLGLIGRGGMGVVYRALDNMGRDVAIKMLHGAYTGDADLLKRFYREARATGSLQHKNIVTIYALGDEGGSPYMVMEFLDGRSMGELISSRASISLAEKLGLVSQVCEGLHYAHQRELVHRDIKPANILVLKDGTVKIVDFGIARVGLGESITRTGQLIGSMYYMSPEQLTEGHIDGRSDIFSTGVMLYELLTYSRPFEAPDPPATFLKITREPAPPLSKYLTEYPAALEEVLQKALAKDPENRFQSAEELGFELSRIQDGLKRGMTEDFLARAISAIKQQDWEGAKQHLQEVLKLDRQHAEASQMLKEVRQTIQKQQRSAQVLQLRSQAEVAIAGREFEEALACIDAALRVDPEDGELRRLRESTQQAATKERTLRDSLQRGEAALYAGDLEEAEKAIRAALELDGSNTDARALGSVLVKEITERSNRAQVRKYIDEARKQISNQDFTSALHTLEEARSLDPSDSTVRELLNWAGRGQEQERRRKDIEKATNEISESFRTGDLVEALHLCDAALVRFPDEPSLLKLRNLAERQRQVAERQRFIEEQSFAARHLADEGNYESAIETLEAALQKYPGESNLEALLAVNRVELERRCREQDLAEQYRVELKASEEAEETSGRERLAAVEALRALRQALYENASFPDLVALATTLRSAALSDIGEVLSGQCKTLLREFDTRQEKFQRDSEKVNELKVAVTRGMPYGEIFAALEQARRLTEQYPNDEFFAEAYPEIQQFVSSAKQKHDEDVLEASTLLDSMQPAKDLDSLGSIEQRIHKLASAWPGESSIQSFAEQASDYVRESKERKARVLSQLASIDDSLSVARSAGQVSLQVERAQLVFSEYSQDPDAKAHLESIEASAKRILKKLETDCNQIKELAANVATAESLNEIDEHVARAQEIAVSPPGFEEAESLFRQISRRTDERRKDFERVCRGIISLSTRAQAAQGQPELETLRTLYQELGRSWQKDSTVIKAGQDLETAVQKRQAELIDIASAAEPDLEELKSEVEPAPGADIGAIKPEVKLPSEQKQVVDVATVQGDKQGFTKIAIRLVLAFSAVIVILALLIAFFMPRPVQLQTSPSGGSIAVDGKRCSDPCTLKLTLGEHLVSAQLQGFQNLQQTVKVSAFGNGVTQLKMERITAAPSTSASSSTTSAIPTLAPSVQGRIIVKTSIPGTSVFVDGNIAGVTTQNGQLGLTLPVGNHDIRVENPRYKSPSSQSALLDAKAVVTLSFKMDPNPGGTTASPVSPVATSPGATSASSNPVGHVETPAAPAPVAVLEATKQQITQGQAITITWQTQNATDVEIEGIGPVAISGTRQLSPEQSITYRLIAKGPGGSTNQSLHIDVMPAAVIPVGDLPAVKAALDRYKEAYESESLDDMKRAWPDISKSQQKDLKDTFNLFNAIRLNLSCGDQDIQIAGDDASANCRQAFTYTQRGKKQPEQVNPVNIKLKKKNGAWSVASVTSH